MNARIVLPDGKNKKEFLSDLRKYGRVEDLFIMLQPTAVQHLAKDLQTLGVPKKNFFTIGMDVFADGEKRYYVNHEDANALKKAAKRKASRFLILVNTRPFNQGEDYLDAFMTLEAAQPMVPTKRTLVVCAHAAYLRGHRKTKGKKGHAFASEPLSAHVLVNRLLSRPYNSKYAIVTPHTLEKSVVKRLLKGIYPMRVILEAFRMQFNKKELSLFAPDEEASITLRKELNRVLGRKVNTAFIRKYRGSGVDKTKARAFVGSVKGTFVLCLDDLTSTGGSLSRTIEKSLEQGALGTMAAVTHMVTPRALVKLLESKADFIAFTNTVPLDYLLEKAESSKATRLIEKNLKSGRLLYLSAAPSVLRGAMKILSKRRG